MRGARCAPESCQCRIPAARSARRQVAGHVAGQGLGPSRIRQRAENSARSGTFQAAIAATYWLARDEGVVKRPVRSALRNLTNRVMAVIDDEQNMQAAVETLERAGIADRELATFEGEEGGTIRLDSPVTTIGLQVTTALPHVVE